VFEFLVLSAFDVATASIEALLFSSFPIESLGSSVRRPLADVLFHVEVLSEDIPGTLCIDGCTANETTCIWDLSFVEVGGG
jgi:hypothetical protein